MRSTGLRSPAGVKRARWWTFPTPQELPAFEGNLALITQHALGTAPPLDKAALACPV